MTTKRSK